MPSSSSSGGIVQDVFEEISLRDKVHLWLSEDENKFQERIELFASLPETKFADYFSKYKKNAAKNDLLASAFSKKAKQDPSKVLPCLNKALSLSSHGGDQFRDILLSRGQALLKRGKESKAFEDAEEVLLHFPNDSQALALKEEASKLKRVKKDEDVVWKRGFSAKVAIKEDPSAGRYLVAKEPISAGEMLAVDQAPPQLLFPSASASQNRCWHCLAATGSWPATCGSCSSVVYCSWKCSKISWKNYHK